VRYTQLFGGYQKIQEVIDDQNYRELQKSKDFNQAQVIQDIIDYLDYDMDKREKLFK
jgi:hypothetical protein